MFEYFYGLKRLDTSNFSDKQKNRINLFYLLQGHEIIQNSFHMMTIFLMDMPFLQDNRSPALVIFSSNFLRTIYQELIKIIIPTGSLQNRLKVEAHSVIAKWQRYIFKMINSDDPFDIKDYQYWTLNFILKNMDLNLKFPQNPRKQKDTYDWLFYRLSIKEVEATLDEEEVTDLMKYQKSLKINDYRDYKWNSFTNQGYQVQDNGQLNNSIVFIKDPNTIGEMIKFMELKPAIYTKYNRPELVTMVNKGKIMMFWSGDRELVIVEVDKKSNILNKMTIYLNKTEDPNDHYKSYLANSNKICILRQQKEKSIMHIYRYNIHKKFHQLIQIWNNESKFRFHTYLYTILDQDFQGSFGFFSNHNIMGHAPAFNFQERCPRTMKILTKLACHPLYFGPGTRKENNSIVCRFLTQSLIHCVTFSKDNPYQIQEIHYLYIWNKRWRTFNLCWDCTRFVKKYPSDDRRFDFLRRFTETENEFLGEYYDSGTNTTHIIEISKIKEQEQDGVLSQPIIDIIKSNRYVNSFTA